MPEGINTLELLGGTLAGVQLLAEFQSVFTLPFQV